jgi:hypothetical protein
MLMEASPTALYVNQSVTDEQVLALERLFQSFDFLHPFMFLRVRRSSISFTDTPEAIYEVMVPGTLKMKIQRQLDGRGDPLFPTAALDHFSNTIEYAHNLIYKSWDQEGKVRWDFSGHQANFRHIDLDSTDYARRNMLVQFADRSGSFNKYHLELIKRLRLHSTPFSATK